MKKLFFSLLAMSLFLIFTFTSCQKDEEEVQKTDKELVSEILLDGTFSITAMTSDPKWPMSSGDTVSNLYSNYLYVCEQNSKYNFKSTTSDDNAAYNKMIMNLGDAGSDAADCEALYTKDRNKGMWKLDDSKGYVELYFNYVPGDIDNEAAVAWKVESYSETQVVVSQYFYDADFAKNFTWTVTLTKN